MRGLAWRASSEFKKKAGAGRELDRCASSAREEGFERKTTRGDCSLQEALRMFVMRARMTQIHKIKSPTDASRVGQWADEI